MLKKALITIILSMCALSASIANDQSLTVYSYRHYESDQELYELFTEQTGIKVNVVKAKADTLLERIKAEGDKTPADLLITSDAARLYLAKKEGLLQPIQSDFLESRIPSHLRDYEDFWFGFTQRARVIVYAPDRVSLGELSDYEDLASPVWRGRVLSRSSSSVYSQSLLASLIVANGEKAALEWAKTVRKQLARAPQGSDRDQMRAVVKGLADAAIVNTYYIGLLQNSDNPKDREVGNSLKVIFPNQSGRGTHVNVSGAGVIAHSNNVEAATKLLEFLASDEAQESFPNQTSEYPVVGSVEWSDQQKAWGMFKADILNLGKLGEYNAQAVRLFNLVGWE